MLLHYNAIMTLWQACSFSYTFIFMHINFHAHLFSCTFIFIHIHFHAHSFSYTFIFMHMPPLHIHPSKIDAHSTVIDSKGMCMDPILLFHAHSTLRHVHGFYAHSYRYVHELAHSELRRCRYLADMCIDSSRDQTA